MLVSKATIMKDLHLQSPVHPWEIGWLLTLTEGIVGKMKSLELNNCAVSIWKGPPLSSMPCMDSRLCPTPSCSIFSTSLRQNDLTP